MPRAMRVEYPGAIYHVMDRGDRREDIVIIGTAKGAKAALHRSGRGPHQHKPALPTDLARKWNSNLRFDPCYRPSPNARPPCIPKVAGARKVTAG